MDGGVDRERQIGGVDARRKGKGAMEKNRERVGLKKTEAEMKEQEGRMNMESSADWFDLPLFFSLSLPPSSCFSPSFFTVNEGSLSRGKSQPALS